MRKQSKNIKYTKPVREWMKLFIKEEMRHGYTKKTATKRAEEFIHNLSIVNSKTTDRV